MHGVLEYVSRNVRVAMALGIVFACVSTAGAIGWLTAPV